MKITERQDKIKISLEVFPPKKDKPFGRMYQTINALALLDPSFISVTYGAGGSTTKNTPTVAEYIEREKGLPALAHLTCVESTEDELWELLDSFKQSGIDNILALRGDLPEGFDRSKPLRFKYATDLIEFIKARHDFCIAAACYPEGHPECRDKIASMDHLKRKIDAGADFLITQMFFDNELFFDFMETLAAARIDVPVLAGIMPVTDARQILRITSLCGASVPKKFKRIMDKYEDNPEALREAGIAYAIAQIVELIANDADGIHLYTMNKPYIAEAIIGSIKSLRQ